MRAWQLTFVGLAAFTAVAMLVPLCRRIALARGIADRPGPGKAHVSPTPYLGGVTIACGVSASALFLPRWQAKGAAILGAALLLATLGLVDDLRTVRPNVPPRGRSGGGGRRGRGRRPDRSSSATCPTSRCRSCGSS